LSEGVVTQAPAGSASVGAHDFEHTELKANAIGLPSAIMQGVALIAPAIAALFFVPFIVGLAGQNAPLVYPIALAITLGCGWVLVQYTRKMPSAGGYFTYTSRALHPWAGWLTSWALMFYVPILGGPIVAYFGFILHGVFHDRYGWNFPWWIAPIVLLPIISAIAYRGISISQRVLVTFGSLEFLIVLALGISGLVDPGRGGFSFSPFNPSHIGQGGITWSTFGLAAIFAVQAYAGWDGAAPLAEETSHPKRNIPRAVLWSIVILGAFLIVVNWGMVVGWGIKDIATLPSSTTLPGLVLAESHWGSAWPILLFAFFSSVMAVTIACSNYSTRVWYKGGETGAWPRQFAHVHPRYKTPDFAIIFQFGLNMLTGLIFGLIWGPDLMFFFLTGLLTVLASIFVWSLGNIGVFFYYRREYPNEFNWFSHFVVPLGATAGLGYLLYKSFTPFPASPYKWSPLIVGLWLIGGIVILLVQRWRGKTAWTMRAGQAVVDVEPGSA
jgi:amino acid transporter